MKRIKTSDNRYVSIPEAASLLGMSRIAVYKKVRKGEIKSIRMGRAYGISRSYITETLGGAIGAARKKRITRAVKKVVDDYGELLRKLGNE